METSEERDRRLLERRVERLELLFVQLVCWASAVLIALGTLLPYMPVEESSDEEDVMQRLISVGFAGVTWRNAEGDTEGISIAIGIGFIGLLVCAVAAVFLLYVIGSASATERTRTAINIVATLLTIGTAVAGILFLMGVGSDEVRVGPGYPVFAAGVGIFLLVTMSKLREWWEPSRTSLRLLMLGR